MPDVLQAPEPVVASPEPKPAANSLLASEDWWSVWIGLALVALAIGLSIAGSLPALPKAHLWTTNPLEAFPAASLPSLLLTCAGMAAVTGLGVLVMGGAVKRYFLGFAAVFALAVFSMLLGSQSTLEHYGLEVALWALVLGLFIANTFGAPSWLLAGAKSEWFIKIGLVLMGAEVLMSKILAYGPRGLLVGWVCPPVIILFMYFFGTKILKISSRTLVMVIAVASSVCGVSAAIASSAACRAKREELSLTIGITMLATVVMMVGMPALGKVLGLNAYVTGAWIGGTVDSTGAVVAAGEMFSPLAGEVAAVVKMIQNALIGIVAFVIALIWVAKFGEEGPEGRVGVAEIWRRFPKFVVGFIGVSMLFSFVLMPLMGDAGVKPILSATKGMRGWWFAMAFVAIGLECDFRQLTSQLSGGKPIVLSIVGQVFNILVTGVVAWLAFGHVLFGPVAK